MFNFKNNKIWRLLTNLWTVLFIAFVILNFAHANRYEYMVSPMSALYIGMLTLFVGTKEFDRWHEAQTGRHSGEIFVILWSILITVLFVFSIFLGKEHRVPSEIVAIYIAVLSIFAITQKSKRIHETRTK
ncbi:MAG: hypothetical protein AAB594_02505 [Patescibacteria group bacterium]